MIDFTVHPYGVDAQCGEPPTLRGFTIISTNPTGAGVYSASTGGLRVSQCDVFNAGTQGYFEAYGARLEADAHCSAVRCTDGFLSAQNATIVANGAYTSDCSTGFRAGSGLIVARNAIAATNNIGFRSQSGGSVDAQAAVAAFNTANGFMSEDGSITRADGATAVNNGRGYYALWQSLVTAANTSANNSGNGNDYVPPTSGTMDAQGALIRWS